MIQKIRNVAKRSLPVSWKIDLPTAAQWENAARAGTDATQLCHLKGSSFDITVDNLIPILESNALWEKGETLDNGNVGQFSPNQYGLYDTIGCMFEAVLDWTRSDANPTTDVIDPTGMATTETCSLRQTRGGRNHKDVKPITLLPGIAGSGYVETYELGHRLCIHLKPITQIAD